MNFDNNSWNYNTIAALVPRSVKLSITKEPFNSYVYIHKDGFHRFSFVKSVGVDNIGCWQI